MKKVYTTWYLNIGEELINKIDPVFQKKTRISSCEIKEIAEAFGIDAYDVVGKVYSAYQLPLDKNRYIIEEVSSYPQTFFWNTFVKKICPDNKYLMFSFETEDNSLCVTNSIMFKDMYRIRGWRKYEELHRFFPQDYYNDISENRLRKMLEELFGKSDDINEQIQKLSEKYEGVSVCKWQTDQLCELTPSIPY